MKKSFRIAAAALLLLSLLSLSACNKSTSNTVSVASSSQTAELDTSNSITEDSIAESSQTAELDAFSGITADSIVGLWRWTMHDITNDVTNGSEEYSDGEITITIQHYIRFDQDGSFSWVAYYFYEDGQVMDEYYEEYGGSYSIHADGTMSLFPIEDDEWIFQFDGSALRTYEFEDGVELELILEKD